VPAQDVKFKSIELHYCYDFRSSVTACPPHTPDLHQAKPLQVIINDPTWKTAAGISVGTSLIKLRQVLGKFKITGLGWDYGNQVTELSPAVKTRYAGLKIVVEADELAAKRFPQDLTAVTGDRVILPASDRHWRSLKIRVSGLTVYFPDASLP
jgi:hypothetical protein